MKITEHEMRGLLAGKCVPGDMRVNEELPAYLVRKFAALQQKLDAAEAKLAKLAKLVPDEMTWKDSNSMAEIAGFNLCRDAILRNIEEAK